MAFAAGMLNGGVFRAAVERPERRLAAIILTFLIYCVYFGSLSYIKKGIAKLQGETLASHAIPLNNVIWRIRVGLVAVSFAVTVFGFVTPKIQ